MTARSTKPVQSTAVTASLASNLRPIRSAITASKMVPKPAQSITLSIIVRHAIVSRFAWSNESLKTRKYMPNAGIADTRAMNLFADLTKAEAT